MTRCWYGARHRDIWRSKFSCRLCTYGDYYAYYVVDLPFLTKISNANNSNSSIYATLSLLFTVSPSALLVAGMSLLSDTVLLLGPIAVEDTGVDRSHSGSLKGTAIGTQQWYVE